MAMLFKLGMDIQHSKLMMPREFEVNRSKVKFTVTFDAETFLALKLLIA